MRRVGCSTYTGRSKQDTREEKEKGSMEETKRGEGETEIKGDIESGENA